jgi:hypothetical protein
LEEERVSRAERELERRLPAELQDRLRRDNGGEITAVLAAQQQQMGFDPYWELHPVFDDSDRRRAARSASHIVHETAEARTWRDFPEGAIAVASNGTGDRLIVLPESDEIVYWNHEDGQPRLFGSGRIETAPSRQKRRRVRATAPVDPKCAVSLCVQAAPNTLAASPVASTPCRRSRPGPCARRSRR